MLSLLAVHTGLITIHVSWHPKPANVRPSGHMFTKSVTSHYAKIQRNRNNLIILMSFVYRLKKVNAWLIRSSLTINPIIDQMDSIKAKAIWAAIVVESKQLWSPWNPRELLAMRNFGLHQRLSKDIVMASQPLNVASPHDQTVAL